MPNRTATGLLLALVLIFAVPAFTQDTSTITGRVLDPTGAVVVGAQVLIVNTATNIENPSQTNDQGMYRVPSLRPGIYRVTVSAPGFRKHIREGIDLSSGTVLAVNASLEVGALADTVEVTGATPLLETETSSTGQLTEGDYFSRLPFFQRSSHTALLIVPGVTVSSGAFAMNLGGFTINGQPDSRLGYFEDGMYARTSGGTADTIQNTIAEVQVLTTTLPAEYGHSAGGSISVVKKSGTNEVHGLISQYGRYGGMSHRKYFDQYKLDQPRPELGLAKGDMILVQNPDANLSGPVYIPKIYDGRNKTFFMFGTQRYIEKQGKQQMYTVLHAAGEGREFQLSGGPGDPQDQPDLRPADHGTDQRCVVAAVVPRKHHPEGAVGSCGREVHVSESLDGAEPRRLPWIHRPE